MSSAIATYGFLRLKWRGRDQVFMFVILTMIVPAGVLLTPCYIIYSIIHLLDTWFPIIAPFFFAKPFYSFMIRQTMMGIPIEMNESAVLDGCNVWQRLLYVILPQAKPALLAVAILAMQDQWNVQHSMKLSVCSCSYCGIADSCYIFIFTEVYYTGNCCIRGKRLINMS